MARTPRSPLSTIIAYAMSAPIAEVTQAIDTIKTIAKQRVEQGLKEPALPLKPLKKRAVRKPKSSPAAGMIGTTEAAPAPVVGRAQAEAAAQSPLRVGTRGPGVGRRRPRPAVSGAVAAAPIATALAAGIAAFPDQAVDPDEHVE